MKNLFLLLGVLAAIPAAFADNPQLYKWTDAQGVVHYSDKAPTQPAPDLQATDMPSFPAQDPAALAAQQAQLLAEAERAQKLVQAQRDMDARDAALAAQRARFEAEIAALQQQQQQQQQQQADSQSSSQPIYVDSPLVSRAYRVNLYVPHHFESGRSPPVHPAPSHPATPVLQKPN